MDALIAQSCERLFGQYTGSVIRAVRAGGDDPVWPAIEASGFLDLMVDGAHGGFDLSLPDLYTVLFLAGRYAAPAPIGQVIFKRAAPDGVDDLAAGSLIVSVQMAGAMSRILELTAGYAGERQQFGRPIASFQAVQQMIAELAGHAAMAQAAARFACIANPDSLLGLDIERIAAARICINPAASRAAAIAHAVHGAIGMAEEYDLHLYTSLLQEGQAVFGSAGYWARRLGKMVRDRGSSSLLEVVRGMGNAHRLETA